MKSSLKFISILLVLLSFVYSIYICYLCFNNAFEGAKLKYNSHNQLVVIEVEEHSLAEYAGLKKGDILLEIDGKSITKKREPAEDILSWAYSVTVKRDAEVVDINTKETFLGYDIFFVFLIPVTFYLLCLFCIFFILNSSKSKKLFSSTFLLIAFLLNVSIAYLSAGGVSRGDVFSRYVNLLTFLSVPVSYLHFVYQYFKEKGK